MKKIILFLISIFIFGNVLADEAADQFAKLSQKTESMSANFRQTITDPKGKYLQQSSGNMALKRPSQFRWYTHQPTRQLVVADGDKLWIYDIDLEQVTIQHLSQTSGNAIGILLSDSIEKVKSNFNIELTSKSKDKQVFKLTPLAKDNLFQWVKLYFNKGKLTEIRYADHMDQTTDLQFVSAKFNPSLKASLFKVIPPKGVDIIDNYMNVH